MCGPACLRIVFAYFGNHVSERQIAKACRTSSHNGTTGTNLVKGAKRFGFNAEVIDDANFRTIAKWLRREVPIIVDWMSTASPGPRHATQPMVDPVLGLGTVFNGCIYNFKELREELLGKGYRFFSDGDTEVILKAYHAWGPRCVQRFFGMFASAVWERDSGRVVLARDRLGIKPLYIAETPEGLRFASTLPALLAAGNVDTSIHPAALHHYMSWHAVVPPPLPS